MTKQISMGSVVERIALLVVMAGALLIYGCGGGSSSSSVGGLSGSGDVTSTVLIRLSGVSGSAMRTGPQQDLEGVAHIASVLSNFLIRDARAAPIPGADVPIYFNGRLVGRTDDTGFAVIAIAPGIYDICFGAPNTNCMLGVVVGDSEIVEISNVEIDDTMGVIITDNTVIDARQATETDYVVYQDPNRPHKLIVCHNDKNTISVGEPAALNAHLGHGDYLGACVSAAAPEEVVDASQDNDSNNGNNGNNGSDNRCNNGKPDKKGCPSS